MNPGLRYWTICAIFLLAMCHPSKRAANTHTAALPPSISISDSTVTLPDSQLLRFTLLSTELYSDSIVFKLKYGGGCIKPHEFQCYSSGNPDDSGIKDIFLSHLTQNDHCKAIVYTHRTYSWGTFFKPGDKIRINFGPVLTIPPKTQKP